MYYNDTHTYSIYNLIFVLYGYGGNSVPENVMLHNLKNLNIDPFPYCQCIIEEDIHNHCSVIPFQHHTGVHFRLPDIYRLIRLNRCLREFGHLP